MLPYMSSPQSFGEKFSDFHGGWVLCFTHGTDVPTWYGRSTPQTQSQQGQHAETGRATEISAKHCFLERKAHHWICTGISLQVIRPCRKIPCDHFVPGDRNLRLYKSMHVRPQAAMLSFCIHLNEVGIVVKAEQAWE